MTHASPTLFFAYGTLRRDSRRLPRELLGGAVRVGVATYRGRLYELGWYPGAVPSSDPHDRVRGDVYRLPDEEAPGILGALDRYEACAPGDSAPHEFRRVRAVVDIAGQGPRACWIYLYAGPLVGLRRIASGDFLRARE